MADKIRYEWDPRKSEANRRKHGIRFENAIQVFCDPLRRPDIEGDDHGEIRWRTIGEINGRLYVVSHTVREEGDEEVYRIVSARKASPREREAYEEAP